MAEEACRCAMEALWAQGRTAEALRRHSDAAGGPRRGARRRPCPGHAGRHDGSCCATSPRPRVPRQRRSERPSAARALGSRSARSTCWPARSSLALRRIAAASDDDPELVALLEGVLQHLTSRPRTCPTPCSRPALPLLSSPRRRPQVTRCEEWRRTAAFGQARGVGPRATRRTGCCSASRSPSRATVEPDGPAGPPRVLVVDDHRTFAELLAMGARRAAGHPLRRARAARRRGPRRPSSRLEPDVVLVDVHLGDVDGLVLAAELHGPARPARSSCSRASIDPVNVARAAAAGVCAYLPQGRRPGRGARRDPDRPASAGCCCSPTMVLDLVALQRRAAPSRSAAARAVAHRRASSRCSSCSARAWTSTPSAGGSGIRTSTCRGYVQNVLDQARRAHAAGGRGRRPARAA